MVSKKVLCIIPARIGSKGVPKKNIKIMNDKPLIYYSIKVAQNSKYINKIVVSSDSKEILDIANEYGVHTPFLRPKELALDSSLDIDYIKHTLEYLKKEEGYAPDYIALLRPTTPIRNAHMIDKAIDKLINNPEATGLRSAHEVAESPFKWYKKEGDYYTSISPEYSLEDTCKPRQSFPSVYLPNGYIDIIKPTYIDNSLYGNKILNFITPTTYEVDTMEDFEYIEYLMKKGSSHE